MTFAEKDVHFDPDAGPVVVEVRAGFGTVGAYRMTLRQTDGSWNQVCAGKLADDVPDACPLTLSGDPLHGGYLLIVGNYGPAPGAGDGQVAVRYLFWQKDVQLDEAVIEEKVDAAGSYQHLIRFHGDKK